MESAWIQFLPLLFWYVITVIPVLVIAGRTGISRWLTLILVIPFLGVVIALWVFAFASWPAQTGSRT
jgi:hypothetical protein